ncbi:MAG TPA: hypothetical protein VES66_09475 [Terriglobales bacterium]|nr:hypothetical protein [Terriglobales bacterium]
MGFEPDSRIEQIAEAYALDAVDLARERFHIALDWSDASVQDVESILKRLHEQISHAKPSAEQVSQFAKTFGSYVGEVFRRNHGARWGMVSLGNDSFPGLQAKRTRAEFWPWGKVQKRLVNGPEDNVWHYFQILAAEDGRTEAIR